MKKIFKNKEDCCKKYGLGVLLFALSVLALSLLIKLSAWVLSWFSSDLYLNTVVVMFSSVVMLIAFAKLCCVNNKKDCSKNDDCNKPCDQGSTETKSCEIGSKNEDNDKKANNNDE